jgi:cytochrome b
MHRIKVWDPFVRIFHWTLVCLFAGNALIINHHSKVHRWVGYVIVGLVLFRGIWGFLGTRYARFDSFRPSVSGAIEQARGMLRKGGPVHVGHTPLGAWMIYNLLLSMLVIGVSGYVIRLDAFWGLEWPERLHALAVTWAEISVAVHVSAVIWESRRSRVNLPLSMVNGYKDLPDEHL